MWYHLIIFSILSMRLDGREIYVDFFNEIVETLGLKDKLERFPSTLSGGQQQRVSIARALLTKPVLIYADAMTTEEIHQKLEKVTMIYEKYSVGEQWKNIYGNVQQKLIAKGYERFICDGVNAAEMLEKTAAEFVLLYSNEQKKDIRLLTQLIYI